jgi:2-polyprenyl-3-methyl-5-hydroxy-6-metoxy-1,4-benzoquinol methylase
LGNISHKVKVNAKEYDSAWIEETWGWDTPDEFIRSQGRNLRPRIRYALKIANLRKGSRILDIGCGRGEVVLHCARQGMQAVGVDYSIDAISIAEEAKATHKTDEKKRMEFICDDVENIVFNEPFDCIFMLDVVEHLYDWELLKLFKICSSLLKPTGILVIHTLPNKWLYEITYRRIMRLFMPWLPANPRTKKQMAIHVNEMSITHLACILKEAGFNFRIWLKDLLVEHACWHKRHPIQDQRGKVYKWIANPIIGLFYKLLALTPLKLLIVNEMFGVGWRGNRQPLMEAPLCFTERFVISIYKKFSKRERDRI